MRTILKSKIHGAKVTDVCVDYIGSITIDKKMMNLVDIIEYEQVNDDKIRKISKKNHVERMIFAFKNVFTASTASCKTV